jgi:hypothetical protein
MGKHNGLIFQGLRLRHRERPASGKPVPKSSRFATKRLAISNAQPAVLMARTLKILGGLTDIVDYRDFCARVARIHLLQRPTLPQIRSPAWKPCS